MILGIRAFQLLPEDLRSGVLRDLSLVLTDNRLAEPLAREVVASVSFRDLTLALTETLPDDRRETLLNLVKATISKSTR